MASTRKPSSRNNADALGIQAENEEDPSPKAQSDKGGLDDEIEVLQPILRQTMELRFNAQDSTFQRPQNQQQQSSFTLNAQTSSSSKNRSNKINGRSRKSRWSNKTNSASQQKPSRNPPPKVKRKLQCLLLGAAGAGKTSIMRRYFHRHFEAGTRVPTLGSDFYIGRVTVPMNSSSSTADDVQQNSNDAEHNNTDKNKSIEQDQSTDSHMNYKGISNNTDGPLQQHRTQSSSSANDTDTITVNLVSAITMTRTIDATLHDADLLFVCFKANVGHSRPRTLLFETKQATIHSVPFRRLLSARRLHHARLRYVQLDQLYSAIAMVRGFARNSSSTADSDCRQQVRFVSSGTRSGHSGGASKESSSTKHNETWTKLHGTRLSLRISSGQEQRDQ